MKKVVLRVSKPEYADIIEMINNANVASERGESTLDYYELPLAARFGDRCPEIRTAIESRTRIEIEILVEDL